MGLTGSDRATNFEGEIRNEIALASRRICFIVGLRETG